MKKLSIAIIPLTSRFLTSFGMTKGHICFLLFAFFFLPLTLFAQTNDIIVYSENGELFTLFVNSVKQNDPPEAKVRARNISGDSYSIRVRMEDSSIPEVTYKHWTEEKNLDITLVVKQNNKGKWSIMPRSEAPRSAQTQTHAQGVHPRPHNNQVAISTNDGGERVESSVNIQTGTGTNAGSVNINMSVTTSSSTTGTTSTSTTETQPVAAVRCPSAMSISDFSQALNTIKSETFEDSKITLAKQVCKNSCMTSEQLKSVLTAFKFEASRLEIAKYAYEFVYDQNKYYLINDAFEFSSSKDELNRYIDSK